MDLPEAFKLCTDVWMVPCRLTPTSSTYKPLLAPLKFEELELSKSTRKTWNDEEDSLLIQIVTELGTKKWSSIAKEHNIRAHNSKSIRKGKHCRERWTNHLNPDLLKGLWTDQEDETIKKKQKELGNRWSDISKLLPGRTENQVKNRWKAIERRNANENPVLEVPKIKQKFLLKTKEKLKKRTGKSVQNEISKEIIAKEMVGLPLRISSISSDPDFQGLPLRISSLTSDPELQSMQMLDFNNMCMWKSSAVDIDGLYNMKNEEEKNEFDQCFVNYLMASGTQIWGFGSEAGNSFFGSNEKDDKVERMPLTEKQGAGLSELQVNLGVFQAKGFNDVVQGFYHFDESMNK